MTWRTRLRWLLLCLVLAGGAGAGGAMYMRHALDQPGPLPESRDIVVPRGSVAQVAGALQQAGVITSPLLFQAAVWTSTEPGQLHAAELGFPAHASLRAVLTILRTAKPVEHRLTIPEGLTAKQITALLNSAPATTGAVEITEEAALLPETYAYEYGTPRQVLVSRARKALDRALDQAWADRSAGLPLSTPYQALILASIVERETAAAEERPRIAAVYLNRLRRGMRLQADPTAAYAASGGAGPLDRPLTRADLDNQDPYNTYAHAGLPPGPICAPGLASIQAVLHPADSDALFFVADGNGTHAFARTAAEHDRNVAKWRALNR
jgi:UPF0755 protein